MICIVCVVVGILCITKYANINRQKERLKAETLLLSPSLKLYPTSCSRSEHRKNSARTIPMLRALLGPSSTWSIRARSSSAYPAISTATDSRKNLI